MDIGGGGDFIRLQSDSFDIILNILIGIKRSLNNLVETPNMQISDWQFKKVLMVETDWMSSRAASNTGMSKSAQEYNQTFRFYDYAPMVF